MNDLQLREGLNQAEQLGAAQDHRADMLTHELDQARNENVEIAQALERARAAAASGDQPSASASVSTIGASALGGTKGTVLFPQTRSIGQVPEIDVASHADGVTFELRLESNEFPQYRALLKDSGTNRIIWRSDVLQARSDAPTSVVGRRACRACSNRGITRSSWRASTQPGIKPRRATTPSRSIGGSCAITRRQINDDAKTARYFCARHVPFGDRTAPVAQSYRTSRGFRKVERSNAGCPEATTIDTSSRSEPANVCASSSSSVESTWSCRRATSRETSLPTSTMKYVREGRSRSI